MEAEHNLILNANYPLTIWEFFYNGPLAPEIHTDMKNESQTGNKRKKMISRLSTSVCLFGAGGEMPYLQSI